MSHYRIVEWSKHQHYKDRDPPWIKLHRELLTSRTWVQLDDAGRVLAVACMLIAAGTENKIPADADYVRRRAYLAYEPDFAPLVAVGFIEPINEIKEIASQAQADDSKTEHPLASDTECSSEAEQRREEKNNNARKARAENRGSRLTDEWKPTESDREFAVSLGLNPETTAAEFRDYWTALPGARGRKLDWSKTFKNRCRDVAKRNPNAPALPAGRGMQL